MREAILALCLYCPAHGQIFGTLVPAADYFVDGNSGSDSNNGSQSSPFQTFSKLTSVLTAGKMGAIFGGPDCSLQIRYREQLTVPAVNVAIVGWGGCKPVLDASTVISSEAWSKTAGRTNVYQTTVTVANLLGWI